MDLLGGPPFGSSNCRPFQFKTRALLLVNIDVLEGYFLF